MKGVNDSEEALENLFKTLISNRIKPYYLHHLDKAPGTSHFRCSIEEGQNLMKALRGRISGICLPQYILDIPGGYGKVPIGPAYIEHQSAEYYQVEDPNGTKHQYKINHQPKI